MEAQHRILDISSPLFANMSEMRLLLFGDGFLVSRGHIQAQVLESRVNPFLGLFFQRSGDALRHEIALLPPLQRSLIPAFHTIDELHERTKTTGAHAGIQNALLCISQLAHYIE